MKAIFVLISVLMGPGAGTAVFAAEATKYPPPRFPSYVKSPKSIEDIMPYARAAVRQTGGRTPLGLVEKGMAALIVTEATADPLVMQAIKKAFDERGVKVYIVPEYELVGIKKEDALKAIKATKWYTSEQGYMEAQRWIQDRFADSEAPKKWLKERRPDLYKAMFEKIDNRWELMNKAATFPGDVWKLAEERVLESLAWVDQVQASDPEGTNMSFEVTEEEAKVWASGAYNQGHLFMSPYQATGRFPFSVVEYPAIQKKWNTPILPKVNGVFAGTSNHTGSFPRVEVHVKDGYVTEVKGGGVYGEVWREFLKYPKISELTYPYQGKQGYWWFYEAGLGTNPKFFKRPDENMVGNNQSERNNAGVIHWGFGGSVVHDPEKPEESKAWIEFGKQHGLPIDHWWHIHNMLVTCRVRVRGTKNTWLTLIDKGELTAFRSPEIRALASRYGDPAKCLAKTGCRIFRASRRQASTRTTRKIPGRLSRKS